MSWLTIFLPEDEYKQRRLMSFLAEAAVIAFLTTLIGAALIRFTLIPVIGSEKSFLIIAAVLILYPLIRYILSGMEYGDIFTPQQYKKQMKHITFRSITFFILFNLIYTVATNYQGWASTLQTAGLALIAMILLFLVDMSSLTTSYKKNKNLEP
ncbi:hypothetical protein NDQ57_17185 [Rossellomorea marisflavi]|uniref:hypothetical protein n=1 Tax=Rossellomorea marisflavi TaxID=189381 RepID=UPI000B0EF5A7|nr:hypothetical protein [Rossellomorea marisflavi]MCM2606403.1 hypothetical protein [Rossellomorea marisflavi]